MMFVASMTTVTKLSIVASAVSGAQVVPTNAHLKP